jgi:hypothetical protein
MNEIDKSPRMEKAIEMYFLGRRGEDIRKETGVTKTQFYRELQERGLATTRRAQPKLDAKYVLARLEKAHKHIGYLEKLLTENNVAFEQIKTDK